jgi:hypothetical protein
MASPRTLAALGALFALVACGGGGSDGGSPPPPPPASSGAAALSVTLTGGASPGIDHLWVTVTGVAMHADATKVYGDGDPGWVIETLATPVTVDLADPSLQGHTVSLVKTSVTALGNYAQLRLLVASSDPAAALQPSASAKGLTWNDQVQYTDGTGPHAVPLELPDPQAGLRTTTPFALSADTTTPVAIEWNARASLVRRASASGADRFTVRDELQAYNQQLLTALGDGSLQIDGSVFDSISGQLDASRFCSGTSHAGCIHDVVASATTLSADGLYHEEVRSVNVAADGSFVLYPLPAQTAAFDVVIHGGNMQTMVVRGVFVDPTGLLQPFPTALSVAASPIVPVLDTTERAVTVANALTPAASRVFFGQTIAGSGGSTAADVPYVIASDAADPLTGQVLHPVTVPGGPLHDATFDPSVDGKGTPPAFTTVAPVEGAGGYSVWTRGTPADGTSALTTLAAGATTVSAPAAPRLSGFGDGTLTVTLSGTPSNAADHAELIVSDDGGTVSVTDVSGLVAAHGGQVAVTLPSGSNPASPAAAVYGVALRTWVGASEASTTRWARATAPTSLVSATTAAVAITIP